MSEHPNLHPEINKRIEEQEEKGGISFDELETGTKVEAQTLNTLYVIEATGEKGKVLVQGGKYFPEPTEAQFNGSTWGGGMLKMGWIGHQMCLDFVYTRSTGEPGNIVTSPIQSAAVIGPDWKYEMEWDNGKNQETKA